MATKRPSKPLEEAELMAIGGRVRPEKDVKLQENVGASNQRGRYEVRAVYPSVHGALRYVRNYAGCNNGEEVLY